MRFQPITSSSRPFCFSAALLVLDLSVFLVLIGNFSGKQNVSASYKFGGEGLFSGVVCQLQKQICNLPEMKNPWLSNRINAFECKSLMQFLACPIKDLLLKLRKLILEARMKKGFLPKPLESCCQQY